MKRHLRKRMEAISSRLFNAAFAKSKSGCALYKLLSGHANLTGAVVT